MAFSHRSHNLQRNLNPVPYCARFFGEKISVVHVVAVDSFSRQIVGFSTMPRKKPITIYNTIFGPLFQLNGICDQVRVDCGTEFALVATIQQDTVYAENVSQFFERLQDKITGLKEYGECKDQLSCEGCVSVYGR